MSGCSGNCEHCGGCAGQLVLSQPEVELLEQLGENAFLPVARKGYDATPIYREDDRQTEQQYGLILICLEKKGLISLDFDRPLKGANMSKYEDCPIRGSMALTAMGQQVLELLDRCGAKEE
jgi:hypothetical protein